VILYYNVIFSHVALCFFQSTDDGVYGSVCEYAVACELDPGHVLPFPPCSQTTWGVLGAAVRYGLEPLQRGAVLRTADGGCAELQLRMNGNRDLRFSTKLRSNGWKHGRSERTVDAAAVNRIVGDVATFNVRLVFQSRKNISCFLPRCYATVSRLSVCDVGVP